MLDEQDYMDKVMALVKELSKVEFMRPVSVTFHEVYCSIEAATYENTPQIMVCSLTCASPRIEINQRWGETDHVSCSFPYDAAPEVVREKVERTYAFVKDIRRKG